MAMITSVSTRSGFPLAGDLTFGLLLPAGDLFNIRVVISGFKVRGVGDALNNGVVQGGLHERRIAYQRGM